MFHINHEADGRSAAAKATQHDGPETAEQNAASTGHDALSAMTASGLDVVRRHAETDTTEAPPAPPAAAAPDRDITPPFWPAQRYHIAPGHRRSLETLVESDRNASLNVPSNDAYNGRVPPTPPRFLSEVDRERAKCMRVDPAECDALEEYRYKRDLLYWDAQHYLNTTRVTVEPRPELVAAVAEVAIDQEAIAQPALVAALMKEHDGLIFGESHAHHFGVAFLLDNLWSFYEAGVDTLYFEHLCHDLYQPTLDDWAEAEESKSHVDDKDGLGKYLSKLNTGQKTIRQIAGYAYCDLVDKAMANYIKVVAIDCVASYGGHQIEADPHARIKMMNVYAKSVIEARQKSVGGKWIALVGNAHTNPFGNVPGLVDLVGGVGIRLAEGTENSAGEDPGFVDGKNFVQANLLVRLKPALIAAVRKTDPQS